MHVVVVVLAPCAHADHLTRLVQSHDLARLAVPPHVVDLAMSSYRFRHLGTWTCPSPFWAEHPFLARCVCTEALAKSLDSTDDLPSFV